MNQDIQQIVFAAGCFWCTEAVFQRIDGVKKVIPGFAGGTIKNPAYREVITGRTGHAEAVEVTFNPSEVNLKTLLEIFFSTHDPTTLNKQGNDVGTQYRNGIFYTSENQKQIIDTFLKLLEDKNIFKNPIVTEVKALHAFYEAEIDHHDYYNLNKQQPYCQFIINPKIDTLHTHFADKLKN